MGPCGAEVQYCFATKGSRVQTKAMKLQNRQINIDGSMNGFGFLACICIPWGDWK